MSWMSEQWLHNRAGGGSVFDTNRQSRKSRCKIISGTAQCESSKLHRACLCLISPTFTEELGLRNLMGKKSLPNFNRTKNDQLRTWQRRSRDGSWRKMKWVTGMGKTPWEYVGETRAWFADPLSRHCSKDMFSVRERKILERVVVHECSSSQWSTCLKLTEKKMDSQCSLEGEPICIRGDALIRLVKTQQNTSIVYQNSMLYILWTFICHLYDIK